MTDPIAYIQRTRDYYAAQGFAPYQWAHHETSPWQSPTKPVSNSRVALVTTAVADGTTAKPLRTAEALSMLAVPAHFRTDELSWDKITTHTDDRESYFPINALQALAQDGIIGGISERFYFVPTEYSQRNTRDKDAPVVVSACQQDEVDIAILVPL